MIKGLIRFSAVNKYLVIAGVIVVLAISVWTMRNIPLDALPDLSDTQVIVYSRWDRSPDILEDQVTYPITTALLGAPRVKAIRGFSDFGFSYVYVIFEDGTDPYWARTRVLEYLSKIIPQLPQGVKTELGPDATERRLDLPVRARGSHRDAQLGRAALVPGLVPALRAAVGAGRLRGGHRRRPGPAVPDHRQPDALARYRLPLQAVIDAVRRGNNDVGGRLVELSGREYMVRGRGYVKSIQDLEQLVLKSEGGTPITVKDVAQVALGPEMRRGVADLDGQGDVVGGIIVMRQGENALNVIERVKAKLEELKPSLPKGVEVVTTYDRSELIDRAIDTVKHKLVEEMIIVSIIILIFLWHIPSAIVPIVTIPVSVATRLHPHVPHGPEREPHVAGRHRHLHRRAGGRRHRRGGERLQQDPPLAGRRREGRLPPGAAGGAARGGPVRLLLAPRHRGRLHAGLHAGRPGGPPVPAARLLEEPGHGDRRAARDHARPGHAHAVRPHRALPVPPEAARLARDAGASWARTTRRSATPSAAPLHRIYEPALPLRAAARARHHRAEPARGRRRPSPCT